MSVIGSNILAGASGQGGYFIDRSLRFRASASAYLNRTPASAGNQKTWTWSGWVKRGASGTLQFLFSAGTSGVTYHDMYINSDDTLRIVANIGSTPIKYTTQVFRDFGAWYHFVNVFDTTNATADDRMRLYVNGVRITSFGTSTNPALNADGLINSTSYQHAIGRRVFSSSNHFDGYLTEVNFIDGQALDPTYFGEYNADTGVWQPKKYVGTYGNNGFYLNFSDNSSTTTLGEDGSGNGNDWTLNNFSLTSGSTYDSMTDVPTLTSETQGNYATLNAVKPVTNSITFSNANLKYKPGSSWSTTTYVEGTIGVLGGSTGKFYWEMSADQIGSLWTAGVALQNNTIGGSNIGTTGSVMIYNDAKYVNGTSTSSYLTSLSANEVLGVALDAATGKVWFRDSGGWLGSGDPAAGTNETGIPTGFSGATLVPVTQANSASTVTVNFGQRPFAYTPPTGFKALNTYNLPDSTVKDGSQYFNTVLYTGTGASASFTGVGFQPDFTWIKSRSAAQTHGLFDSNRGVQKLLQSNSTAAEITSSNYLTSFDSDGFSIGSGTQFLNDSGASFVSWNWKANGSGVSNTDGSITSTVSANTTAGFSIVTFTGTGSGSDTVGHGLGVAPSMVIVKRRDVADGWPVYHSALGVSKLVELHSTSAQQSATNYWGSSITSTTFGLSAGGSNNRSGSSNVAYCFAEVEGFSKMGKYIGNFSTDGPFVYTGFRPAFVLTKCSSTGSLWGIWDTERNTYNPVGNVLQADSSASEVSPYNIDVLSNGFKFRDTNSNWNGSGQTFIFVAFAENPFKNSLAR